MTEARPASGPPVWPDVVGLVPAAGASTRMGEPKGLLRLEGRTFVQRAVDALRLGGCGRVVVVVRTGDVAVAAEARTAGAEVLENPDPGDGPITSLRLALEALPTKTTHVAWLPLDHPTVRPGTVRSLLEAALSTGAPVSLPVHQARRGHPAVFARRIFGELADPGLEGGARTVVHRHLDAGTAHLADTDDPGVLVDVDTPAEYEALTGAGEAGAEVPPTHTPSSTRLTAAAAARLLMDTAEAGGSAAVALGVGGPAGHPALGQRLGLTRGAHSPADAPPEHIHGDLPQPWRGRLAALLRNTLDDPRAGDGLHRVGEMSADDPRDTDSAGDRGSGAGADSPDLEVYVEVRRPVRELVIVGAGHIAQPLARTGATLGFRVSVLDDRPDFATRERFPEAERVVRADFDDPFKDIPIHERTHIVLVTRGHKYDYACLVRALRMDPAPAYIGMIGSRRRVRATYVQLMDDGIPRGLLARIHAPVGLDIGAETPEEIAVAVAAELVLEHRGGSGRPLKDLERIDERFFKDNA